MTDNNLYNWIVAQNFYYKKQNVRPWGTYDLLVSTDNDKWAKMPHSFGYGFTEPQALESECLSMINDENFIKFITQWLSDEKVNVIRTLIEQDLTTDIPISSSLVSLPETTNVSEHIHNTENT